MINLARNQTTRATTTDPKLLWQKGYRLTDQQIAVIPYRLRRRLINKSSSPLPTAAPTDQQIVVLPCWPWRRLTNKSYRPLLPTEAPTDQRNVLLGCRLRIGEPIAPAVTARAIKPCDGWIWPGMASFLTTCPRPERRPTSRGGTEARGKHQVHFCPASVGTYSDKKSQTKTSLHLHIGHDHP